MPPLTRLALEAAAAGGHHLCVTGPPGAAIPALAAGLTALLPPLDPAEAIEVSAVHSVAGLLASRRPLITRPPLRSPHHTATPAALAGGGPGITRPGEAALAHRGVLFLQDAPEFAAGALRVLRQPLQHGEVTVARGGSTVVFPARFILVAGMAPCPCGAWPGCECTPLQARRYRARFTGELGSYIAIWLQAAPPDPAGPGSAEPGGPATRMSCQRRASPPPASAPAAGSTARRGGSTPISPARSCAAAISPTAEALAPISRAVDLGEISPRAAHQVIGWPGPWPTWPAKPGPERRNAVWRWRSSWGWPGDPRQPPAAGLPGARLSYPAQLAGPLPGRQLRVLRRCQVPAALRLGIIPGSAADAVDQAGAGGLRPAPSRWHARAPLAPLRAPGSASSLARARLHGSARRPGHADDW